MERPKPFSEKLPVNLEYHQILGDGNSVCMHSGRVVLLPGQDCGEHSTGDHEELIIILSGEGELEVEGSGKTPISAGLVAYNPPHTKHNVRNTGALPLTYIYVVTPAS
jgi:mannose-6-phosphate isomerase-like protein (cupin superfamily)